MLLEVPIGSEQLHWGRYSRFSDAGQKTRTHRGCYPWMYFTANPQKLACFTSFFFFSFFARGILFFAPNLFFSPGVFGGGCAIYTPSLVFDSASSRLWSGAACNILKQARGFQVSFSFLFLSPLSWIPYLRSSTRTWENTVPLRPPRMDQWCFFPTKQQRRSP